ncbi:MAG: right-handed parallel beta-helix repeat-containing protein, partial [Synergistaceae bacterium]|nr:right-handed parallel beta-helix repeat-containing protein [Synergistaceae bacterium]
MGGGKAFAADWYVVSGDTGNQIKYYQASTPYNVNNWSSANSSTNTANDLNTFLNNNVQDGDTVYIKAGTYKLSAEINLKLLYLYGGFDGTETTSSDRNFETGTILDAAANRSTPRRVLIIETASTIDGFTIKGGYLEDNGGGIYINGSPTITNCIITGNATGDITACGGGIYINGSPTITNCIITGNATYYDSGGGININSGNPTITNCIITGNTTQHGGDYGGGIHISGGNPIITNCTVTGNTVLQGEGGGIHINSGNPTIINCTIAGNNATGSYGEGGGIHIGSGNPTITNCTIVNNTAGSNQGNEIYFYDGTTTLRN